MANEEGFHVALFKLGTTIIGPCLSTLFNKVVFLCFLDSWSRHIIHLIHNFGLAFDPRNYRTIMIGHTFYRFYATTLSTILSSELDSRNCRATGQARFRVDY